MDLPENAVTAIAQTHDGYMWFGTLAGLARFDGERFQTFDSGSTPRLQDGRVSALYEDSEGTLWIGHDSGLVTFGTRTVNFEMLPGASLGSMRKSRPSEPTSTGRSGCCVRAEKLNGPTTRVRDLSPRRGRGQNW